MKVSSSLPRILIHDVIFVFLKYTFLQLLERCLNFVQSDLVAFTLYVISECARNDVCCQSPVIIICVWEDGSFCKSTCF